MKRFLKVFGVFTFLALALSSCATLKPYERVYVNDAEMQMNATTD